MISEALRSVRDHDRFTLTQIMGPDVLIGLLTERQCTSIITDKPIGSSAIALRVVVFFLRKRVPASDTKVSNGAPGNFFTMWYRAPDPLVCGNDVLWRSLERKTARNGVAVVRAGGLIFDLKLDALSG